MCVLAVLVGWSHAAFRVLAAGSKLYVQLGRLKVFLSVLLLLSFVGAGAESGLGEAVARLHAARDDLVDRQRTLHRALVEEATSGVADDVAAMLQPETRALAPWQAYARLASSEPRVLRATFRRFPQGVEPQASRPAAGGVAAPRGLLDGLAAAEIGHAVEQARATRPPTRGDELHPIATTIVQAALDDTAAGFLRSAVVAIDHPVLDLLTSSFLDPALAQSIRAEVEARVHDLLRALHEGRSLAAGRERRRPGRESGRSANWGRACARCRCACATPKMPSSRRCSARRARAGTNCAAGSPPRCSADRASRRTMRRRACCILTFDTGPRRTNWRACSARPPTWPGCAARQRTHRTSGARPNSMPT